MARVGGVSGGAASHRREGDEGRVLRHSRRSPAPSKHINEDVMYLYYGTTSSQKFSVQLTEGHVRRHVLLVVDVT